MVVHVQSQALLGFACYQTKRGNWFGVSDSLKLAVEGETFAELMEDIGLTLDAIFKDLYQSRELERFLQDHGWRLDRQIQTDEDPDNLRFDMPFLPELSVYDPSRELHR